MITTLLFLAAGAVGAVLGWWAAGPKRKWNR